MGSKHTNKIIHGDCMDVMDDIQDNSIDLLVTDPPYRIMSEYGGGIYNNRDWMKNVTKENLNRFTPRPFLNQVRKKMKKFNAYIFTSKGLLKEYIEFCETFNYNWNLIVLCKKNPIPTKCNKYLPDTELVMFIREKGAYFNSDREYDFYRKCKSITVTPNEYHPTQKDKQPIKEMISISSDKGDVILDPFLGSGTTAICALELDRKYIGIESKKKYVDISKERIKNTKKTSSKNISDFV